VGKKSLSTIMFETDGYAGSRDVYRGAGTQTGMSREEEKHHLSLIHEHGREKAMQIQNEALLRKKFGAIEHKSDGRGGGRRMGHNDDDDEEEEETHKNATMIRQLVKEVDERARWLEEMRESGLQSEHEQQVRAEITQRLAQLKRLGFNTYS